VVFDTFQHVHLLDRLCSLPSTRRFWPASLSWTLAVRFVGCDARFDGVSAIEARNRLEELTVDLNHAVPPTTVWQTLPAQEAVRALFWAHISAQASVWRQRETSLSRAPISTSSDGADSVSDRPPAERPPSSPLAHFVWLIFHNWYMFMHDMWIRVCRGFADVL
jgi:hypothetical protein